MSRHITPELRQWIVSQAQAGHDVDRILDSMQQAGWQPEVAMTALETTLRDHLGPQAAAQAVAAAVPMPEPDLSGNPLYLDAGDRRVAVLASMTLPRLVVLGGLLSDEECDALIEAARPRMRRSLTVAAQTGGEEVNAARTSQGMFFERGETELAARIEARLARLLRWPLENGEGLQVLQYGPGAEYLPHYDYFDPEQPGTTSIIRRGGQRVGTVVMYLNEPEAGGATSFPDIGFQVAPKRGNAVFFSYPSPHPGTRTLHGGAPVIAGEKWIATKWLRERAFV